ncbi:hypothetical protein AMTR_s00062p00135500 [Amborella trichopoda]|uniref:Uncharacterized protein n=1 Tax=Amborella trichopoda TaxID=13333 RepID=U5DBP5_AMBTC|nr:hypothetical protein AMTR_s00062p00135500 [Amborella trichopoda]
MPNRRTDHSGRGNTTRWAGRTETKVGHSDSGVPCGRALAQWIKGTPGITADNSQELLSTESFGTLMSTHHILGLKKVPRVRLFAD